MWTSVLGKLVCLVDDAQLNNFVGNMAMACVVDDRVEAGVLEMLKPFDRAYFRELEPGLARALKVFDGVRKNAQAYRENEGI